MRKLILAIVILASTAAVAYASCPFGTRYQCKPVQVGNTVKMMCGCY